MTPFWTVILFWLIAIASVLIALAFVLVPLLRQRGAANEANRRAINIAVYRDQLKELESDRANGLISEAQFETARQELETRLAADALVDPEATAPAAAPTAPKALVWSLAALLPAAAFGLYAWFGNTQVMTAIAEGGPRPVQTEGHDMASMIAKLEERTRAQPDDGEAWLMLGRAYGVFDQWDRAVRALERAYALLPEAPAVLSAYAEALAITAGRRLEGRPIELVGQALARDPNDMKAVELSAIHALQNGDYVRAADHFQRLLQRLPPDSQYAREIDAARQEALQLAKAGPASPSTAHPNARIRGRIELASELRANLKPTDTVFLFARAQQEGSSMPLAAIRAPAQGFPIEFELDDTMAMSPDMRLSSAERVTLIARVSRRGDVKPQSGDLEGMLNNVKVGSEGVVIRIDSVRP